MEKACRRPRKRRKDRMPPAEGLRNRPQLAHPPPERGRRLTRRAVIGPNRKGFSRSLPAAAIGPPPALKTWSRHRPTRRPSIPFGRGFPLETWSRHQSSPRPVPPPSAWSRRQHFPLPRTPTLCLPKVESAHPPPYSLPPRSAPSRRARGPIDPPRTWSRRLRWPPMAASSRKKDSERFPL